MSWNRREPPRKPNRPTTTEAGYGGDWARRAKQYRDQHPICLPCQLVNLLTPSQCVDHIQPHRGNLELLNNPTNWQALCHYHHVTKTWRERGGMVIRWRCDPSVVVISDPTRMRIEGVDRHFQESTVEVVYGDVRRGYRVARAKSATWHVLELPGVVRHQNALESILGHPRASEGVRCGCKARRTV